MNHSLKLSIGLFLILNSVPTFANFKTGYCYYGWSATDSKQCIARCEVGCCGPDCGGPHQKGGGKVNADKCKEPIGWPAKCLRNICTDENGDLTISINMWRISMGVCM